MYAARPLFVFLLGLPVFPAHAHDHTSSVDCAARPARQAAAGGSASSVDYRGMAADRGALNTYLTSLSAVSEQEYAGCSRARQMAFLINAYNAFTIDLVLSRYPDPKSIKDLGSTFRSPWKRKLFVLPGQKGSLDDIEHGMLRAPGIFDEPRIHVAVVCASIGSPMLSPQASTPEQLDR